MDKNGFSDPVSNFHLVRFSTKLFRMKILWITWLIVIDYTWLYKKYVEVDLKPKYNFMNIETKITSIVKANLNPVYNNTFEL